MNDQESKITMCDTPKTMTLDICKSCQRYSKEDIKGAEIFKPEKKSFGWQCKDRIHTYQGSLFA